MKIRLQIVPAKTHRKVVVSCARFTWGFNSHLKHLILSYNCKYLIAPFCLQTSSSIFHYLKDARNHLICCLILLLTKLSWMTAHLSTFVLPVCIQTVSLMWILFHHSSLERNFPAPATWIQKLQVQFSWHLVQIANFLSLHQPPKLSTGNCACGGWTVIHPNAVSNVYVISSFLPYRDTIYIKC